MRLFKLINADSAEMTLSGPDGLFLYPDGLGFDFETDYSRIENEFAETDERVKQKVVTGTMVFVTETAYLAFLTFINSKPLRLGYSQSGSDYKYLTCKVSRLKKDEYIKRREWCRVDVDFDGYGQWEKSITPYAATAETETGKTYPYTYPYTYTLGAVGSITLNNTGDMPAPLIITVRGPSLNPSWILRQSGVFVSSGGMATGFELTADEQLIVDSRVGFLSMSKCDLDGNLLLNVWQQSDMQKENYIDAPVGESSIIFSQAVGTADASVEMLEMVYTV